MLTIIYDHIKCSRQSNHHLLIILKRMATAVFTSWDIIYPIRSFDLKRDMVQLFHEG